MLVLRNLSFSLNHILFFLKPSSLSLTQLCAALRRLVHHFTNNFMCTSTLVLINTSYIRITYKYRVSFLAPFNPIHNFFFFSSSAASARRRRRRCLICMPKFTFFLSLLFFSYYKCLHFSYLISDIQLLFFKFFRISELNNKQRWERSNSNKMVECVCGIALMGCCRMAAKYMQMPRIAIISMLLITCNFPSFFSARLFMFLRMCLRKWRRSFVSLLTQFSLPSIPLDRRSRYHCTLVSRAETRREGNEKKIRISFISISILTPFLPLLMIHVI